MEDNAESESGSVQATVINQVRQKHKFRWHVGKIFYLTQNKNPRHIKIKGKIQSNFPAVPSTTLRPSFYLQYM